MLLRSKNSRMPLLSGVRRKEGTHVMITPQVYILGPMSYLCGSDSSIIHEYILLQHIVLLPLHLSTPDPYTIGITGYPRRRR